MSARDVSAHYSAGEGLTALLGGMEHATLESISIENSATHTHTHRQEQGGGGCGGGWRALHHLVCPHCCLLSELHPKGQSRRRCKDNHSCFGSF